VSEETIRQLAGRVTKDMRKRYAHIRDKSRRDAIATLEGAEPENLVQKLLQSDEPSESLPNLIGEMPEIIIDFLSVGATGFNRRPHAPQAKTTTNRR
jgi:hypothetical protein